MASAVQSVQGSQVNVSFPLAKEEEAQDPITVIANKALAPQGEPVKSLLNRFKPYFYFDRGERYFPASIQYYVDNSALMIGNEQVANVGEIDYELFMSKNLDEWRAHFGNKQGDFSFKPYPGIIYGEKNWREKARIYGAAFNITEKSPDGTENHYIGLNYVHTYAYDNPYSVLKSFFPKDRVPGWHQGDMENIILYLQKDGDSYTIKKAYYSAHGSAEDQWFSREQLKEFNAIVEDTHPLVYVAQGTHASRVDRGTHVRLLGLFNDVCDPNEGELPWIPEVSIDDRIFNRDMNYGVDAVSTYKDFMHNQTDVVERTTTLFMRLFGAIASGVLSDAHFEWLKKKCMVPVGTLIKSTYLLPDALV